MAVTTSMRSWANARQLARGAPILPNDAPMATAPGSDPDRVLLIGGSPAAGLGCRSHGDSMTGLLAALLADNTGRGAVVESAGRPSIQVTEIVQLLTSKRVSRFDAVVLVAGMADAIRGTSTVAWTRELALLVASVSAEAAIDARIVVTTIPPPSRLGSGGGWQARLADHRARVLNRATRQLLAPLTRATPLELNPPLHRVVAPTVECYRGWSARLAEHLAPMLTSQAGPTRARQARALPDSEEARLSALNRTGLQRARPDRRFDDLAQRARALLGGEIAAVGFLDADTHWLTAQAGDGQAISFVPRSISPCDHTIRSSTGLIVGDLTTDPRFVDNPLLIGAPGLRFYAGYPIESPDGYRIGSICVLGTTPRDPATVDLAALQLLAFEARTRL